MENMGIEIKDVMGKLNNRLMNQKVLLYLEYVQVYKQMNNINKRFKYVVNRLRLFNIYLIGFIEGENKDRRKVNLNFLGLKKNLSFQIEKLK